MSSSKDFNSNPKDKKNEPRVFIGSDPDEGSHTSEEANVQKLGSRPTRSELSMLQEKTAATVTKNKLSTKASKLRDVVEEAEDRISIAERERRDAERIELNVRSRDQENKVMGRWMEENAQSVARNELRNEEIGLRDALEEGPPEVEEEQVGDRSSVFHRGSTSLYSCTCCIVS
jgi:hypothetical protein